MPADVNGTPAHPLQNAGLGQRSAAQSRQNDGLPWSEILEDSEDLDLEFFDPIPVEDRFTDPAQSRADVLDWEKVLTGGDAD